ncbi:MAG TPA: hypothetical protein VLF94_07325, partial [Chlamydiales bacterium]|nr:hypothetical protein [Chlamydiales bacterium]
MNIKEFSSSGARFAKKWSGIQDFSNGYTAYQKKDYHSLAKNLAIGLLKVGAIGAALYGAYHWTFSKPVSLSGAAANQKPTPETKKTSPQTPTEQQIKALAEEEKSEIKSMEERVDNLYEKYGNSHQWPDDDFQFALWQPSSDTKASAAFITRLLAQAIPRKDGHIITQIKRECLGSGDTQPCLAALKSFVGDSTTPPTEQTLTEAAWINADCQVGLSEPIQNKYCTQAYEEVKRQAIALKCLLSVKGILELMARAPEISEKDVPFAEKAVALYTEELRKKESIVVEHHVKGDKWD